MAIFRWLSINLALKNHDERIKCQPYSQFRAPTEKLLFGSLLCVQNVLSFCILSKRSTDRHVDRSRPKPCSISRSNPLNRPQYLCYRKPQKKTRRRSFALMEDVKSCGKFIITGKSVLYFKRSGKVKS